MCLLLDAEPLAFRALAATRRRSPRLHAASDQHARQAVEAASPRDRLRPSLSGAIQMLPGRNRRLLLPGRSLRGAKRVASQSGRASRIMALVEPVATHSRSSEVSYPLGMALAVPERLGAYRKSATVRSGIRGNAMLRESRAALRRSRLGRRNSQTTGPAKDTPATR